MTSKEKQKEIKRYMMDIYKLVQNKMKTHNCDKFFPEEVVAVVISQECEKKFIMELANKYKKEDFSKATPPIVNGETPSNVVMFKPK